jgi:hypothetical protein
MVAKDWNELVDKIGIDWKWEKQEENVFWTTWSLCWIIAGPTS